jgi:hypothetical protein
MKNKTQKELASHDQWKLAFAEKAFQGTAQELDAFPLADGTDPDAATMALAEAALQIGLLVINEIGGLIDGVAVLGSRDNIIIGLADVVANGHERGPHLGHDIVDAVSTAMGEKPDRSRSTY